MVRQPIYTELSNCRDCYKCVRNCPVKAIQIKDAHAEIIYDRCTYCGTCVNECPNGVKQIRNDVDLARMALMSNRKVIGDNPDMKRLEIRLNKAAVNNSLRDLSLLRRKL